MKVICLITLILTIGNLNVAGQNLAPKYSNEFLSIGVGARSFGMSNATVASINDVTAGYWNPAGLANIDNDYQIGLMHSEYFAGIAKYDYGAGAIKLDDSSALAVSIIRFGVDNIPNTTELIDNQGNIDYARITTFSAADYAFIGSYARKISDGLQVGGNAKIIYRQIGDFAKAWGFGLDIGLQYQKNNWQFGAMVRDVTSTFNAWSYSLSDEMKETFLETGNSLPENSLELTLPKFTSGVGINFTLGDKVGMLAEVNAEGYTDGKRNVLIRTSPISFDLRGGVEFNYKKFIFVRGGLGNFQFVKSFTGKEALTVQPNIGLGLKIRALSIDYALTDIGDASAALYSNVFSLRIDINKPKR